MARPKLIEQFEAEIVLNESTRSVSIKRLQMRDPEFYEIISEQEEASRPRFVERSLKVGAIALRDVGISQKIDYVKREFEIFRRDLDTTFKRELGAEGMKGELDGIFSENGRLQQCLDNVFGCNGKLARDILDLNNKKSPIGQLRETIESYFVGKDSKVYGMLDPHAKDSPMCCLREDLLNELKTIETKITEQMAKQEIIQKTPQKGYAFEDTLENYLQQLTKPFNDLVERVGHQKGKLQNLQGDFVVTINDARTKGEPPRIVIEAKAGENLRLTPKGLLGDLNEAIKNRDARYAIAVAEKRFSEAVGCYRQIEGDKTICTFEENGLPLEVAYQVARTTILLNMCRETERHVDTARINDLISKITNDLSTFQSIKTKLTQIGKTTETIATDIKTLETNIRESLAEMQENLYAGMQTDNNPE